MSRDLQVGLVATPAERAAAYAVRQTVFVDEQQVPLDIERDAHDDAADHWLGRLDGVPVATARLLDVDVDGVGLVGRVAVLPDARGTGIGAALMSAVERRARERGLTRVELHAQVAVRGFYERLGYTAFGDEYDEAGIRHVSMAKDVAGS
jgi:predicted GNAT family N-acyltransferase